MPNNRKIIDYQTRHSSRQERDQHRLEDEAAPKPSVDDILVCPVDQLRDPEAVDHYQHLAELLAKDGMIGDEDKDNLVIYCNAWSTYLETQHDMDNPEMMCKDDIKVEVSRQLALQKKNTQAVQTMSTYGNKLGLSVSARLQKGAEKVKQKEAAMEERFGAL